MVKPIKNRHKPTMAQELQQNTASNKKKRFSK